MTDEIRNEEGGVQKVEDGGPAFPLLGYDRAAGGGFQPTPAPMIYAGMTLRDWLVGQAINGICSSSPDVTYLGMADESGQIVNAAEVIADEYLQRSRK